ncbi:hypothetical protein OUZ56_013522 [Daphnia magna]|uniref:Uncharacterized protein n=1 Tax=Daphnia magna TaxID=35525 RepID=A0ABQ9Z6X4_9CRUS|nr:hypothetical protein OUZ56_013522 [Daphnia magna]
MLSETADKEGFATFFLARLAISTDLNSSSHLGPFTLGYLIARDNWRAFVWNRVCIFLWIPLMLKTS